MIVEKCALCGNRTKLIISHYIPNFVIKWIKKTSGTGFARNIYGHRVQDGVKKTLLCESCEQNFSIYESYFASNFFHPFNEDDLNLEKIQYNENLLKFIISISWRILHDRIEELKMNSEPISKKMKETYLNWKNYLTGLKSDINLNSHYMLFSDNFIQDEQYLHSKYIWYITRAIDATWASNGLEFIFFQIPRFSFFSQSIPQR